MAGGWGTGNVVGPNGYTVFVPDGASRRETAILLVGTAEEFDLDQRSIKAALGGFYISDELADLLGEDRPGDGHTAAVEATPETEQVLDEITETVSGNSDEDDPDGEFEEFDPADHKVEAIKAVVENDPSIAQAMLDAEEAGKNRPSLVNWLRETIASGDRAAKNEAQEEE